MAFLWNVAIEEVSIHEVEGHKIRGGGGGGGGGGGMFKCKWCLLDVIWTLCTCRASHDNSLRSIHPLGLLHHNSRMYT